MRHEIAEMIEPERRELREHFALVGNARPEHVVERRDAIGRDDEQVLAEIVDVADFAAPRERETGEIRFEERRRSSRRLRRKRKPITSPR